MNMVRCMLKSKGLLDYLWGEATSTAVYVLNISPTKRLEGKHQRKLGLESNPVLLISGSFDPFALSMYQIN